MSESRSISGKWRPGDPDTGSHLLLPFEVPAGTARLDLRYRVEALGGAEPCRLDLGLFGPDGFRGCGRRQLLRNERLVRRRVGREKGVRRPRGGRAGERIGHRIQSDGKSGIGSV